MLIPDGSGVHISKKIKDPELRTELLMIGNESCPDGFGLIIRTASGDITDALLAEEVSLLLTQWQSIQAKAAGMIRPGLMHRREKLDMRLIRDMREISGIMVNSQTGYQALLKAK